MLHPWANRIGANRYSCAGVVGELDDGAPGISRDASGLAIHGLAIPGSWLVTADGPSSCFATASYAALAAFPFPHRVDVRLTLDSTTLIVLTTLWPLSAQPVPVAFGWHPYFLCDRARGCELTLPARRRVHLDANGLPTGRLVVCAQERIHLTDQHLDDGFSGLTDGATFELRDDLRTIRVRHDRGYASAQVFAPVDAPVVSLEPMTAPTDALRSDPHIGLARSDRPHCAEFAIQVTT